LSLFKAFIPIYLKESRERLKNIKFLLYHEESLVIWKQHISMN